ncbi:hypothetical protein, partial [Winkia sp. UMB0889B]|uniref:hypothetical protein n=1 Tax=Winkia sp. UMB0889B TaxID=3046315 RepID=UPI0025571E2E
AGASLLLSPSAGWLLSEFAGAFPSPEAASSPGDDPSIGLAGDCTAVSLPDVSGAVEGVPRPAVPGTVVAAGV